MWRTLVGAAAARSRGLRPAVSRLRSLTAAFAAAREGALVLLVTRARSPRSKTPASLRILPVCALKNLSVTEHFQANVEHGPSQHEQAQTQALVVVHLVAGAPRAASQWMHVDVKVMVLMASVWRGELQTIGWCIRWLEHWEGESGGWQLRMGVKMPWVLLSSKNQSVMHAGSGSRAS